MCKYIFCVASCWVEWFKKIDKTWTSGKASSKTKFPVFLCSNDKAMTSKDVDHERWTKKYQQLRTPIYVPTAWGCESVRYVVHFFAQIFFIWFSQKTIFLSYFLSSLSEFFTHFLILELFIKLFLVKIQCVCFARNTFLIRSRWSKHNFKNEKLYIMWK